MLNLAHVAVNTTAIYVFLIVGLRMWGRRLLGQLTIVDYVVVLILGSAVELALIAGDSSLPAGLVSAATLLAADRTIGRAVFRSHRIRQVLLGGPLLLVHNGRALVRNIRSAELTEDDVLEAMREQGITEVGDVLYAVLEIDGRISVIRRRSRPGEPQPTNDNRR